MRSISEVSRLTGITPSTLRYYEKIGLLPHPPQRQFGRKNGVRRYDDEDIRFLHFIHGLKQTGMKLEDIGAFTEDGCLLTQNVPVADIHRIVNKRMDILDQHLEHLEQQIERLQTVKRNAKEKRAFYSSILNENCPTH